MRALGFLLVAGCAPRVVPLAAPNYAPVSLAPASPRATLYADCLADAIANHRVAEAKDPDTTLLVFTCQGASAQAFYEGLGDWSAREHSQFTHEGRTYRSTARVRHDLFGVDYCSVPSDGSGSAAVAAECAISLNAGEFVQTTTGTERVVR